MYLIKTVDPLANEPNMQTAQEVEEYISILNAH